MAAVTACAVSFKRLSRFTVPGGQPGNVPCVGGSPRQHVRIFACGGHDGVRCTRLPGAVA